MNGLRASWEKNWPDIHCAFRKGFPEFVFARTPRPIGPGVPVFCFHTVSPDCFRADMRFLAENGYVAITADALGQHLAGENTAPQNSIVISVDDGALNLFRVIHPLLEAYDQQAVAFISPCFHPERNTGDLPHDRPCAWEEIRIMHDSGRVDFQSHTHQHRYIPRWPEPADLMGIDPEYADRLREPPLDLEEDLQTAKRVIEEKLSKTVRHLAFPRYDGTDEAVNTACKIGYRGFWRGTLPHRRDNPPGASPAHIVRISGEFLRRLPGTGRIGLGEILRNRVWKRMQGSG